MEKLPQNESENTISDPGDLSPLENLPSFEAHLQQIQEQKPADNSGSLTEKPAEPDVQMPILEKNPQATMFEKAVNNGKCIPMESVNADREYSAMEFAEGNESLRRFLLSAWDQGLRSEACCAGDSGGVYVSFKYDEKSAPLMTKAVSSLNHGESVTYYDNEKGGAFAIYGKHNLLGTKVPEKKATHFFDKLNSLLETEDAYPETNLAKAYEKKVKENANFYNTTNRRLQLTAQKTLTGPKIITEVSDWDKKGRPYQKTAVEKIKK